MPLLDIFKKKPAAPPPFPEPMAAAAPPTEVPLESVIIMRQQGLTNPQIIQALQRQGYTSPLVAEALRQAEAHSGGGIEPMAPATPEAPAEPAAAASAVSEDVLSQLQKSLAQALEDLKSVQTWKTETDEKMADVDKRMEAVATELKTIHQAVFAQIQEYNKALKGVGTEIIAMEKVFSEALPELTSSIQELQRTTRIIKGEPEEKKKPVKKAA